VVKQAIDQTKGQEKFIAIKVFDRIKLKNPMQKKRLDDFNSEMGIMMNLDHPYILKLLEIINDEEHNKIYLVMEYIKNGSMTRRVN
jgi:serine/threonine protein kinase